MTAPVPRGFGNGHRAGKFHYGQGSFSLTTDSHRPSTDAFFCAAVVNLTRPFAQFAIHNFISLRFPVFQILNATPESRATSHDMVATTAKKRMHPAVVAALVSSAGTGEVGSPKRQSFSLGCLTPAPLQQPSAPAKLKIAAEVVLKDGVSTAWIAERLQMRSA
jgi:hypothetical protein